MSECLDDTALLILIGGRQVPNVLSAQFLQPAIIVPVASQDALAPGEAWDRVRPALREICPNGLQDPVAVDAFDLEQIRSACEVAVARFPNARWVFNITCATTVMSIGAYEVAKRHGADAWYFDTRGKRVIALAGSPPSGNPYVITVHDYLRVYNRAADRSSPPTDAQVAFATALAQAPDEAMEFRERLRASGASDHYAAPRILQLQTLTPDMVEWCNYAAQAGLLDSLQKTGSDYTARQIDGYLWKFIDGDWLEIFAWDAARRAGCFDDYCFNVRLPTLSQISAKNEIDLAATSAASLLVAECKTEGRPFRTNHLEQLKAITSMIGGTYVSTLFITARSRSHYCVDAGGRSSLEAFLDQAKAHQIGVVTGEYLTTLPDILRKEIDKPKF